MTIQIEVPESWGPDFDLADPDPTAGWTTVDFEQAIQACGLPCEDCVPVYAKYFHFCVMHKLPPPPFLIRRIDRFIVEDFLIQQANKGIPLAMQTRRRIALRNFLIAEMVYDAQMQRGYENGVAAVAEVVCMSPSNVGKIVKWVKEEKVFHERSLHHAPAILDPTILHRFRVFH
ncbi:hypothetical protein Cmtc_17030 [Cupriavidus sp. TKC]|uniref:hypothetical protein n=1 Tax=Cupriavidus sp. TKC TaxID=2880159 RepID=UPI0025A758ED|nr:hypothetical protein [Cupriavidus sp. TKC]GMG90483.1 hypothetical protein Cmtc_17030 [Cupriavidus sp. TKC]